MHSSRIACIGLAAAMAAWPWTLAAAAGDLTVSFKFTAKCSRQSPEIKVGNVPPGTAFFRVHLRDHDAPGWQHGGGTVPADASGVIPAGALTDGYNGPCPPDGSHEYELTVKALNADKDTLAEGSGTQRFP